MKILHVIPGSAVKPDHRYLGSTKDVRCRTEYFRARGIDCEELVCEDRRDEALEEALSRLDLDVYAAVWVELAFYPRSLAWLRCRYPNLRIVLRPANAQFFHRLEIMWLHFKWRRFYPSESSFWNHASGLWERAWESLKSDRRSAQSADHVLAISAWEKRRYWNLLASRARRDAVTFFAPEAYQPAAVTGPKRDECVCMTSSSFNPFVEDALRNFNRMVERWGAGFPGWCFSVTGDVDNRRVRLSARIQWLGCVSDPMEVLRRARALIIPSGYGHGFKTKILDAILRECYVLLPANLFNRLPSVLRPYCLKTDFRSEASVRDALERCRAPFPPGNPNMVLKREAFREMDRVLFGDGKSYAASETIDHHHLAQ